MKTNNLVNRTTRLTVMLALTCLFINPISAAGYEGKHKTRNRQHEKNSETEKNACMKQESYFQIKTQLVLTDNALLSEEGIVPENWMKDIHDPFWKELLAADPEEQDIEAWMSNPQEWY